MGKVEALKSKRDILSRTSTCNAEDYKFYTFAVCPPPHNREIQFGYGLF